MPSASDRPPRARPLSFAPSTRPIYSGQPSDYASRRTPLPQALVSRCSTGHLESGRLQNQPHLQYLDILGWRHSPDARAVPAWRPFNQANGLQPCHCLAHRSPADPESLGDLRFGYEFPRPQETVDDGNLQILGHMLCTRVSHLVNQLPCMYAHSHTAGAPRITLVPACANCRMDMKRWSRSMANMPPCTRGKSRLSRTWTTSRPIPGQAKMVSTITVPPSREPRSKPTTVITGIKAF